MPRAKTPSSESYFSLCVLCVLCGYQISESESSFYVILVLFVVNSLFPFGCGSAALSHLWLNFFSARVAASLRWVLRGAKIISPIRTYFVPTAWAFGKP
jgi:hypothetical protein